MTVEPSKMSRRALLFGLRRETQDASPQSSLDDDSPTWTSTSDPLVPSLFDTAMQLAHERREPSEAIAGLVAAAGGGARGQQRLGEAALMARVGGMHHDTLTGHVAHALLQAAASGEPLAEPTPAEREHFAAVARFNELSGPARWDQLVGSEPALAEVREVVSWGVTAPGDPGARSDEEAAARYDAALEWQGRVGELVGPRSGQADPLLRSGAVLEFVGQCLLRGREDDGWQ